MEAYEGGRTSDRVETTRGKLGLGKLRILGDQRSRGLGGLLS